ncbi:MAG: cupin domain-containing protein [Actinomycetota bacterium]|nr:cupin domain-containing protein [Actinomycetota bacterium]
MAERPRAQGTPAGLTNWVSGERYVFHEGDDALRWETYIARPGDGPPEHSHPRQEERFLVRSGVMGVRVGGRESELREGEELLVSPGASHRVWNTGQGELHATVEMRPATPRFRAFLEAGAALP